MEAKDYVVSEVKFWMCPKDKRIKQNLAFRPFVKEENMVTFIDTELQVPEDFIDGGEVFSLEDILLSKHAPSYLLEMFRCRPFIFDFEINFIAKKLVVKESEMEK